MENVHEKQNGFIAGKGLGERLEQTLSLYRKNFIKLTILMLVYNIIFFIVSSIVWNQSVIFITQGFDPQSYFTAFLFGNIFNITIFILILTIGVIAFIIFFIPVFVGTIKSVRDIITGKQIHIQENLAYGFSHFFNIIKVYWYIFQYVFLTPTLLIIGGGLIILTAMYTDIDTLYFMGGFMLIVGILVGVVYSIYRGLRSTFRLYGAIESEDFTKESFITGLQETKGKIGRVFGNFFVVGLLIGIMIGITSVIAGVITDVDINRQVVTIGDVQEVAEITPLTILYGIITIFFETVGTVFVIVFTYIFYLLIRDEYILVEKRKTLKDQEMSL